MIVTMIYTNVICFIFYSSLSFYLKFLYMMAITRRNEGKTWITWITFTFFVLGKAEKAFVVRQVRSVKKKKKLNDWTLLESKDRLTTMKNKLVVSYSFLFSSYAGQFNCKYQVNNNNNGRKQEMRHVFIIFIARLCNTQHSKWTAVVASFFTPAGSKLSCR